MKRVLSIDYDYFLKATTPRAWVFYPDGGLKLNTEGQRIVWTSIYASAIANGETPKTLFKVDTKALSKLTRAVLSSETIKKSVMADSHAHIYAFIKEIASEAGEPVEVVNLDHHHDSIGGSRLHCGNWLKLLLDEGVITSAIWCANDGADKRMMDERVKFTDDLDAALGSGDFDAMFICRSGSWMPPHLDEAFMEYLVNLNFALMSTKDDMDIKAVRLNELNTSRYNQEFQKNVAILAAQQRSAISRMPEKRAANE